MESIRVNTVGICINLPRLKTIEEVELYIIYNLSSFCPVVKRQDSKFNQSHDREVPRWEIFMEQELRFGLDLG